MILANPERIKKKLYQYLMERGYNEKEAEIYLSHHWNFVEAIIEANDEAEKDEMGEAMLEEARARGEQVD